jgi:hypothetical protein
MEAVSHHAHLVDGLDLDLGIGNYHLFSSIKPDSSNRAWPVSRGQDTDRPKSCYMTTRKDNPFMTNLSNS